MQLGLCLARPVACLSRLVRWHLTGFMPTHCLWHVPNPGQGGVGGGSNKVGVAWACWAGEAGMGQSSFPTMGRRQHKWEVQGKEFAAGKNVFGGNKVCGKGGKGTGKAGGKPTAIKQNSIFTCSHWPSHLPGSREYQEVQLGTGQARGIKLGRVKRFRDQARRPGRHWGILGGWGPVSQTGGEGGTNPAPAMYGVSPVLPVLSSCPFPLHKTWRRGILFSVRGPANAVGWL